MASTAQNITATQATRPETIETPRPRPVDEVAPHSPSSISQKPTSTAASSPDQKKSKIKLEWPTRIVEIGAAIIAAVFIVITYYAIKTGNDKNDAAQMAFISAQSDANALDLLTYCSEHKDLPDCNSIIHNDSGISALLTRIANPLIISGPSASHAPASSSPTVSAPAPTKSSNLPSSTATNLPSSPVTDNLQFDLTRALLLLLVASYVACLYFKGYRDSRKNSPGRSDEEKAMAQGTFDKSKARSANSAEEIVSE